MPTGWRPKDVQERYPLNQIDDPYSQIKYNTNNSFALLSWTWLQHGITVLLMFHLFTVIEDNTATMNYLYAFFLLIHIFSFTSLLDYSYYAIVADIFKIILGFSIIYSHNFSWFGLNETFVIGLIIYFITSLFITCYFYRLKYNVKIS